MAEQPLTPLGEAALRKAKQIKEDKYREFTAHVEPSRAMVNFTAGAPGAGKSEYVKTLVAKSKRNLVLDPDEYRAFFAGYNGHNSEEFNSAATHLLTHFIEKAMKDRYHLIIDTNFAHFEPVRKNIENALKYNYRIFITYVYSDPQIAWAFVKTRQRRIKPETFKKNLIACRETLRKIMEKEEFKNRIILNVIVNIPQSGIQPKQVVNEIIQHQPPSVIQRFYRNVDIIHLDDIAPMAYTSAELDAVVVY